MVTCDRCLRKKARLSCGKCEKRFYCSRDCLSGDWKTHYLGCGIGEEQEMDNDNTQENEVNGTEADTDIGLLFGSFAKKNKSQKDLKSKTTLPTVSQDPCVFTVSKLLGKDVRVPGPIVSTQRHGKNVRFFICVYKIEGGELPSTSGPLRGAPVETCSKRKLIWARIAQNFLFEDENARKTVKNRFIRSLKGLVPDSTLNSLNPRITDEEGSIYPGRYEGDVDFFLKSPKLKKSAGDIYKFKLAQLGRMISPELHLVTTESYVIHIQVLSTEKATGKFEKTLLEYKGLIKAGDIPLEGDSNFAIEGNDPNSFAAITLKTTLSGRPTKQGLPGTAKLELMSINVYFPDAIQTIRDSVDDGDGNMDTAIPEEW